MDVYCKQLIADLHADFPGITAEQALYFLYGRGIIETTMCKIYVVRRRVDELVAEGESKLEAMWIASREFGTTFENVRKYVYYYKDVTFD